MEPPPTATIGIPAIPAIFPGKISPITGIRFLFVFTEVNKDRSDY